MSGVVPGHAVHQPHDIELCLPRDLAQIGFAVLPAPLGAEGKAIACPRLNSQQKEALRR
jgi:hypothetical protein